MSPFSPTIWSQAKPESFWWRKIQIWECSNYWPLSWLPIWERPTSSPKTPRILGQGWGSKYFIFYLGVSPFIFVHPQSLPKFAIWFEQLDDFLHFLDPSDSRWVDCLAVQLAECWRLLWREQISQHFDHLPTEGVPAALRHLLAFSSELGVLSFLSEAKKFEHFFVFKICM